MIKPESGAEIVWMLLSLLTCSIEDQLVYLGGLPDEDYSGDKFVSTNGSALLVTTLQTYVDSWLDEFGFDNPAANALIELVWNMPVSSSKAVFVSDARWLQLRFLAGKVLQEQVLDAWIIDEPINFGDYIEIVDT
ncbi:hypothetical protein [Chitinivorax sp. B]|uniref:hypothetical protein n=1 Tax=Chitinivorax sp. B TaxID=2502235 RepID=UPI0010F6CA9D|nr:hypothetical protein [Chitinivorax sp. B]